MLFRSFYLAVLPVEGEGDDGVSVDRFEPKKLADLSFVQEQLSLGSGIVIVEIAEVILIDVCT